MVIRSQRLDLIPLTPSFLRAALERNLAEAERIIGLSLVPDLFEAEDVLALRLQQLEADPTLQPWMLRVIARRLPRRMMIGHIGFHTAPDAESLRPLVAGGVEFGFTVFPDFRRQGYAREASIALMHWAHHHHGTRRFVLSIRPENSASQRLAAALGFVRIGSHIDEVDGLEDILMCDFEAVPLFGSVDYLSATGDPTI